jgi:hypothetical protein|tara:strand:- start:306 stop:1292 length:987 start_codon:yes stop_codon:yes gene_type:complete
MGARTWCLVLAAAPRRTRGFPRAEWLPQHFVGEDERACVARLFSAVHFPRPDLYVAPPNATRCPARPSPERPLFYSRVEKTGGTLLRILIKARTEETGLKEYGLGGRQATGNDLMHVLRGARAGRDWSVYAPHSAFGLHHLVPGAPCCYVTMLREPLDRMVSLYLELFQRTGVSVVAFLHACNASFAYHNQQTVQLCGSAPACVTPDALELARSHLDECYVYGTLESLPGTLARFHATYPDVFPAPGNASVPVVRHVDHARAFRTPAERAELEAIRTYYPQVAWADYALFCDAEATLSTTVNAAACLRGRPAPPRARAHRTHGERSAG